MTKPDECDFCSSHEVVRRYQCMDFRAESVAAGVLYDGTRDTEGPTNLVLNSHNYWAACAECAKFVDAEDIEGLLKYVKKMLLDPDPLLFFDRDRRVKLIRHLRLTYEMFFKTRIRIAEE